MPKIVPSCFPTPVPYSLRSASDANASPGAPEGEGGSPAPPPNLTSNRRLQQTQAQVDEVKPTRMNSDTLLENKLDWILTSEKY